jgi:acetyl-CoA C-acetyltransferase
MHEAVIVSTARSPIGRAGKGSLKQMRPDDLTGQMVQAALAQVPALDPRDIADLMLGCGQPAGESGSGSADGLPDTRNPLFGAAAARTESFAGGGRAWTDPRLEGLLPDLYLAMGRTAENVAQLCGVTREEQDAFGVRSQNLAEKAIIDGFWAMCIGGGQGMAMVIERLS